jgi:hypothetical protein
MKFSQIKTFALAALGIKSLDATALTAEQKETLTGAYGEPFTTKFEAALSESDPETKSTELHAAMKAFFAPQAEQATADITAQLEALQAENTRLTAESATNRQTIATLLETPEDLPASEGTQEPGKPKGNKTFKIAANASHYVAALSLVGAATMQPAAGTTMDVSAVRQEFGTYLSSDGNNTEIIKQLFGGFTSAQYFKSVPAVTEYRAIQSQINSVVQQFTNKWTPKGQTKFTPLLIVNRRHKINVPIVPSEVLDSYLFKLYDESLTPSQMPITKYIWEELIYPQILEDIEYRMIFKGKYVENLDPNQPTDPEESMDGLETILVEQKALGAAAKVNFTDLTINWNTADDATVMAFFEGFVDKLKPLYKNKVMNLYCAPEILTKYERAYKKIWGTNSGQSGNFGTRKIDFSNVTVVALDGMTGSPIVFSTVDNNMVKLRHKNEAPNVINQVFEQPYEVQLIGEFWLAVGFRIAEAVFAYVPNGYDPQASLKPSNQFPDGTTPAVDAGSGSGAGGI